MNTKVKEFIKNFSYSLSSNLTTMFISALVILIIPKVLGVEEYGYWQLFVFYSSYVPLLQMGWTDGIYLRYSGHTKEELNKIVFFSQLIQFVISQIILAALLFSFATVLSNNTDKVVILKLTSIYMLLTNIRYFFTYVLQATNRFKEFSRIIILDRLLYVILLSLAILFGFRSYHILVIADLLSKLVSLIVSIFICQDIAIRRLIDFKVDILETITSIKAGIQLMMANTASMLIIGSIRFGIEKSWDVTVFAKISLSLSISKMLIIFINAIGVVMFPLLRRINKDKLNDIFITVRDVYSIVIFGVLLVYYPLKEILIVWLPDYAQSVNYMVLLFPISVYEGKMALLINPYLKTLRKETIMLKINIIGLVLSIFISVITTLIFKNLTLAVLSIVIVLGIRCNLAEVVLSKALNINKNGNIVLELIMITLFMILGFMSNTLLGGVIYLLLYFAFAFKNRGVIRKFMNILKTEKIQSG